MKHRFPTQKLFRKGLELYGQQASRLREPGYREAIARTGIVIVEGRNDVIWLDTLSQPAVGVMSNRITDEQLRKVVAWAMQLANVKVTLMFDNDEHGTASGTLVASATDVNVCLVCLQVAVSLIVKVVADSRREAIGLQITPFVQILRECRVRINRDAEEMHPASNPLAPLPVAVCCQWKRGQGILRLSHRD